MSWHEDDSFWAATAPALAGPEALRRGVEDVRWIEAQLGLGADHTVLDLGAGLGPHARPLARRGCTVTAVDRSAALLDALSRAEGADAIERLQRDVRTFARSRAYDAALVMGGVVGLFDDPEEDATVLRQALRSLVPGGALVVEVRSKELAHRQLGDHWWPTADGTLAVQRTVSRGWARFEEQWRRTGGRRSAGWTATPRLYAATELAQLLLDLGVEDLTLHGGGDGRPFDQGAERLIAVARAS